MCTVTEISKHRSTPFVDMCTCLDAQTTARLFSKASNRRSFLTNREGGCFETVWARHATKQ